MRSLSCVAAALFLGTTAAFAAPATDATVKQLLSVTESRKMLDSMRAQMDANLDAGIQKALQGKQPTAKQQAAITRMKSRMVGVVQEELAWDKLEPIYVRLYQESFSEEEVKDILAFYKTPAGQAVIHRMPGLMQKSMMEIQKTMGGAAPKIRKIQEEFAAEMKGEGK